jgi:ABC-2 type transport system permease protein
VVAIMAIAGLVAVAAGLQTLLRMRGDETAGRAELLLSTPTSRVAWLLGPLLLAVLAAAVVCVVSGAVAGLSFLATPGSADDRFATSLLAGVAQLPMVICFLGIAALALAVLPRAATAIAWGALAVGYALGPLGGILQLKQWARDISPFEHTPQVPGSDPDWGPAMIVLAVGVAAAVIAAIAMRRRQVTP